MGSDLDRLLPPAQQSAVVEAIQAAEKLTTGQIKVHLEARCREPDAYARAVFLFGKLGLQQTRRRSGVLLYVAVEDRRFSIIGDAGIHAVVGEAFWKELATILSAAFARGAFGDGLVAAIGTIGERLRDKLPADPAGDNEVDDSISTDST